MIGSGTVRGRRVAQAWRVLRHDGARALVRRAGRAVYRRVGADAVEFPLVFDDVADSRDLRLTVPSRRPSRGTPLVVGWVCTPPGPGSGGHTTMFRMVEAVEVAGHTCVLYLYDRYHGDLRRHTQVIRNGWPAVRAEVRTVAEGLAPHDAYVASAWPTAHVLAARRELPTRRLYLVQDYEPYFHPHGSEYTLAEDTYRFGFRCIAVGRMVAQLLSDRFGVSAAIADYGSDTAVYRVTNSRQRNGVVFYAKRDAPRRGFELGVLALREFHRMHPDQPIHIFGDPAAEIPFPVTDHRRLTPAQLNDLYNQCRVGLAMSFTNVSLVAAEMLAAGVVPVMSGSTEARMDFGSSLARWAEPTPGRLAEVLSEVVGADTPTPTAVAASATAVNWDAAKRVVVATIEDEVYGGD